MANSTAPARAAHIENTRVVRNHTKERERSSSKRRFREEEEEEEGEGEEEEEDAGKKKKRSRGPWRNGTVSRDRCMHVCVHYRIKQFPDQTLIAENGQLMCEACDRKPVCLYKNTVRNHCKDTMHTKTVQKLKTTGDKRQVCRCVVYSDFLCVSPFLTHIQVTAGVAIFNILYEGTKFYRQTY